MDLKNLEQKFKQKLHLRRFRADHNLSDQGESQLGHKQPLKDAENTPTGVSTTSNFQEGRASIPTSAPTRGQLTPSYPPGGSSGESQPEPKSNDMSIHELWSLAYEDLRESDGEIIKEYEAKLDRNFAAALGSPLGFTLGSRADRRDQMNAILQLKMNEVNRDTWKLKFGSTEVQVKDLVQPVLGVVNWANEYITGAVSANPVASVAWAGVSLLLPLFLNPAQQAASLAKGLEDIASLIIQGHLWETLYIRRCEMQTSQIGAPSKSIIERIAFKDALKTLYHEILRFQVESYCYYDTNSFLRLGQDIVKWNGWDDLIRKVKDQESIFVSINATWKDITYAEERLAADTRHAEALRRWQNIGSDVSSLLEIVRNTQEEKKRDGFLDWLCTLDPSEAYNSARDKHTTGTSDWLIRDSEEQKAWETSPSSLLWLSGKPGCGKSILSSSVIEHLRDRHGSNPRTALAYFFFSFSDPNKQKVDGMLASILKQIYARRPNTPDPVQNLREYKARGERPDTKTLEAAILATSHGFSATFIIIDALDECPSVSGEREKLLISLSRLVTAMPGNIHIWCTSRAEPDIATAMESLLCEPSRAKIDLEAHLDSLNHDIGLSIDETLASYPYRSWPGGLKAYAKTLLIERGDGMFQYIFCQFEALRTKDLYSEEAIRKELESLPLGLDDTYERLLLSLNKHFRARIISLLKWLTSANRDLRLEELAEIFIIRPECEVVFNKTDRLFETTDLIKYLSSLIVVHTIPDRFDYDKEETYIRLAHFTIKEYLMSSRITQSQAGCFSFSAADAHLHIAHSCLAYCLYSVTLPNQEFIDLELRSYAIFNWRLHLEMVPRERWPADITNLAARALATRSKSLRRFIEADLTITGNDMNTWKGGQLLKPHLYTTLKGLFNLTDMLISGGAGMNPYLTQEDLDNGLYCAALKGWNALVQLFINKGADCSSESGPMGGALHAAAYQGHCSIVEILLDRGVNVNAQHGEGGSALQAAISGGHLDVVKLLVRRGSDVNASWSEAGCAITLAVPGEPEEKQGNLECIRFLLENGADINRQCPIRGAALHHAAANIRCKGGRKCVRLLLERGADVNLLCEGYGYPLHAMCSAPADSSEIKMLLDRGADVNAFGGRDGTALQALFSSYYNDPEWLRKVAKILLDRGADINIHGGVWGSALQAACMTTCNMENAKFLIENGADIGFEGGLGGSALQGACRRDNFPTAQLLLDEGANVNVFRGEFGSPLQAAAAWGKLELLELLLSKDADINKIGGRYGTPLQAACMRGNTENVRILLDRGAEVNLEGGEYGTALQAACQIPWTDLEIPLLLIEHGANVHAQGGKFGSAWHAAATQRGHAVLQLLLGHNINIDDTGGLQYATALHAALESDAFDRGLDPDSQINRIGWLLDRGANANVGGGEYGFPLQAACANEKENCEKATKFLLEKCPQIHVNATGGVFGSALQAAAHSGQTDSVRMLLDRGANVNIRGGIHRSALNAAIFQGYWDIVEVLLKRGAIPDSQPDEVWLEDVLGRLGRGAVERYWKFWEKTGSQWNSAQVHREH